MASLRASLFLVLFSAIVLPQIMAATQVNCSYIVKVETSCMLGAGTDDHISLRFGDSAGNHVIAKHLMHPIEGVKEKPFGRCSHAMFKIEGPCVNQSVCYLYLKRVGSDEWRPGKALVHAGMDPQVRGPVDIFYFRRFIPTNVWHGYDYCNTKIRGHHSASSHAKMYTYAHHEV